MDTFVDTITEEIPDLPKDESVKEPPSSDEDDESVEEVVEKVEHSTPDKRTPREVAPDEQQSKLKFDDFLNLMEVF